MKIGASGASGHLGGAVVSELLQRPDGREVVAIVRQPTDARRASAGDVGQYSRPHTGLVGGDRLL